ncbi:Hypothetical Protein FCC1311_076222 [Hondaea fermentalgiana]|uniref:Uncharacterized protein n=1 Tax=Hondaea fermentalgiana TaxID=2315210 RepID=A0A2R5GNT1_9STRA|nr:Hypothetical Protein FCC1311_076222 [Hondaea fermentalgiana]|eukprot:GBG31398.1 Hypothetical Protein FCC1311_076222 [Hondaea fermentalgiana]
MRPRRSYWRAFTTTVATRPRPTARPHSEEGRKVLSPSQRAPADDTDRVDAQGASTAESDDDDDDEEEDREEIYDENEEYEYGDEKRKEGIRAAAVLATLEFAPLEPADVLSSDEEEPEQAEKMEQVLDRIRSLRRRKEAAAKAFADDDSDSGAAAAPAQPARSGRRGTGIFRTGRKLIKSLRGTWRDTRDERDAEGMTDDEEIREEIEEETPEDLDPEAQRQEDVALRAKVHKSCKQGTPYLAALEFSNAARASQVLRTVDEDLEAVLQIQHDIERIQASTLRRKKKNAKSKSTERKKGSPTPLIMRMKTSLRRQKSSAPSVPGQMPEL